MLFAAAGEIWVVLIVPAIGFVVWLLSMLFRNATQPTPPNRNRRPPGREADEPRRQTSSDLDRFISDTRRQREQDEKRTQRPPQGSGAARQRRPVILEEVEDEPRPAPRPPFVPPRPVPPRPTARPAPVVRPAVPVLEIADTFPSAPVMQTMVATALPVMPDQPLAAEDMLKRTVAATSPLLLDLQEMLQSPPSAQLAFALREIFDAPLCRRRRP
jgi:hypothetical protein